MEKFFKKVAASMIEIFVDAHFDFGNDIVTYMEGLLTVTLSLANTKYYEKSCEKQLNVIYVC